MRIVLVAMPWHSLDTPSLAVGILHERVKQCRDAHEVRDFYAHLKWSEYIMKRSNGRLTTMDYTEVAEGGIFDGLGDWIFSPALHGTAEWNVAEYMAYLQKQAKPPSDWIPQMHRWSPDFIERMADEVLALEPDLVGFTSTFMQNVASLALARCLKQRNPRIKTAMGGANCDGPQGVALHRNYGFLDFVVRGEGEQTFVDLLDALSGHGRLEDIAGLCWRNESGQHVANPDRTHAFPSAQIPAPNYDDYFATLADSPVRGSIEPKLVMEGARGCWWGEKHHCTFCGLNGSMMEFRSKSPDQLWEEMRQTVEKYQTLDILMVDNIIDLKYFKGLLPHIAQSGLNLRIHYEVKSNLNAEQIHALRGAGVVNVQPGIENLSSRVLKLMAKGVGGCHNVQTIRECEEQGLTVSWNYLFGFPGEEPGDYTPILEQLPALVHLQPPTGATRIALERFSPNFEKPEIGFRERQPERFYSLIYGLPEQELMDVAYLFATPHQGITGEIVQQLSQAVGRWRERYRGSDLTLHDDGQSLLIRDRRVGWPSADYLLEVPHEVMLYRQLRRPQAPSSLAGLLRTAGHELTPEQVAEVLAGWRQRGLVFEEDGRFIALAVRASHRRIRQPPNGRRLSRPERPEGLPKVGTEVPLSALASGVRALGQPLKVSMQPGEWDQLVQALEARGSGPMVAVSLQGSSSGDWPSVQHIEKMMTRGVLEVQVPWEMEIGTRQPEQAARFVRFLRDATAHRLRVRWHGGVASPVRARSLLHLEPPALPESGSPDEALRSWSEAYTYGRCYWRAGPGFVSVKDTRAGQDTVRFTLDDGPLRDTFMRLHLPQRLEALEDVPMAREALEGLMEEELVLQVGDWFLALPYQVRHWPIPFAAI